MKKVFLPVSLLTLVLVIAGILVYQTDPAPTGASVVLSEYAHVGMILVLFVFGIYHGVRRSSSRSKGLPEDDELSKQVVHRAASLSFFGSLFVWLLLLFIDERVLVDSRVLYSYGFLGMAALFVISWSILNFRGVAGD